MILLDTHTVLWWQAGGERLSERAAQEIAHASTVLVSPVSCWEIAVLVAKGRIGLDREPHAWIRDLFSDERISVAPLTPESAVSAALLGSAGVHGDPVDRMLCATAQELSVPLVSKDAKIHEFSRRTTGLRVVW